MGGEVATILERVEAPGPKKLLALDGGGIRGLISVEVLAKLESVLRERLGAGSDFVLGDYFDYVAGTSTGAIIAACIARGMSVATIRQFYMDNGKAMFDRASLLRRFRYKYEDDRLAGKLKEVFGGDSTLGSDGLRTLLMIVMRNASTDSPWPISNNPRAKYNLNLPLWQLVRASTAAPTFFPPEVVRVGQHEFVFVDGGVTTYNNPAFLLFLMATVEPYRLNWRAGEKDMLVISIGTGTSPKANVDLGPSDMNLLYNAGSIPSALMFAALNEQDMLCRVFGRCVAGDLIDRELGDLCGVAGPVEPRLFTYARYNCELSRAGLDHLGLESVDPVHVQQLDSIDYMRELQAVGTALATHAVKAEHFDGFI
jgi:hypothetical protein